MRKSVTLSLLLASTLVFVASIMSVPSGPAYGKDGGSSQDKRREGKREFQEGRRLFEQETFGGNGRTCLTCHSRETGTVSPEDALLRFLKNPNDPLFLHDGSDDRLGNGVSRMLKDATILVEVPLPPNVRLADDPTARSVFLPRGIPTTLNTPALDDVLMSDGRDPDLISQARGAILGHAQAAFKPDEEQLRLIAEFQRTDRFFSSPVLRRFARGGLDPELPQGRTDSEKRGRRFFVDTEFNINTKEGICAACHSGRMLNETNAHLPLPVEPGSRFQTVLVSELNTAGNKIHKFIFTNPDGSEETVSSPDPGRALITGDPRTLNFDNLNAFKIPSLWGVRRTAPYFHDNSAKTLEDVAAHYAQFFALVTNNALTLSEQDQADIVAFMRLLD
jgi:hypothetical protein